MTGNLLDFWSISKTTTCMQNLDKLGLSKDSSHGDNLQCLKTTNGFITVSSHSPKMRKENVKFSSFSVQIMLPVVILLIAQTLEHQGQFALLRVIVGWQHHAQLTQTQKWVKHESMKFVRTGKIFCKKAQNHHRTEQPRRDNKK